MEWIITKWEAIQPGHILRINDGDEAPADLAILTCGNKDGIVMVDTMNLDGETNLKEKSTIHRKFTDEKLKFLYGQIQCDSPNENLENWDA